MKKFRFWLVLGLIFGMLGLVSSPTQAFFTNQETSESELGTGILDLEITPDQPVAGTLLPLTLFSSSLTATNVGSLFFEYYPSIDGLEGDESFCEALWVRAEREGTVVYTGYLTDLLIDPSLLETGEAADWEFFFSFENDDPALMGLTCAFRLVFDAYLPGGSPRTAFFDVEGIDFELTSGTWQTGDKILITEVYYDVAKDKGEEGNQPNPDEWIEIYNPTTQPVNIKDWTISDNNDTAIIHRDVTLPPGGFAVLAKSASTWTYWSIPSESIQIALGSKIGNGLSNTGDRVVLTNDQGVEVDAVSWGTDTYAFSPSVPIVAEGHSISRIDKNVDTDTAADWMDTHLASFPMGPNPGTNPHPWMPTDLDFFLEEGDEAVGFRVTGLDPAYFSEVSYEITYDSEQGPQGILGESVITGSEFEKRDLYLGTCSPGGGCSLHTGILEVQLNLELEGVITRTLQGEIVF